MHSSTTGSSTTYCEPGISRCWDTPGGCALPGPSFQEQRQAASMKTMLTEWN